MIILVIVGVVVFFLVLWLVPKRQVHSWHGKKSDPDWLKLENETRATLAQILGGALVLSGAYFTYANMKDTEKIADSNLEISRAALGATQSSQLAERFTKAIGQLGASREGDPADNASGTAHRENSMAVRLGGIYALEQIYNGSDSNSREYHLPVIQILTAYVREKAAWKEKESAMLEDQRKSTPTCESEAQTATSKPVTKETAVARSPVHLDVETIVGFLAHRKWASGEAESNYLDLRGVDLGGLQEVTLVEADFDRADLSQSFLERVNLSKAQLRKAILKKAHLRGADLSQAIMEGAFLSSAQLEHAKLEEAHLENADLSDAQLKGAILSGAYMQKALLDHACLDGADLNGTHLEEADLVKGTSLKEATLIGAFLNGAHLSGACLTGANLEGAHLNGAYLSKANLQDAILIGADLTGALLDQTNLQGADLSDTVGLTWEQLSRAYIDDSTKLPALLEERRKVEHKGK